MKNWSRNEVLALAGIIVAILLGILALCQPEVRKWLGLDSAAESFLSYENKGEGITMKYPEKWGKQVTYNPISKQLVEFISPKEGDSDTFRERVIVSVEPANMSLDEYTNLAKQEISKLKKDAKITKEDDYTFTQKDGYRVVYTVSDEKHNLKKMEVWTLKNYKAYSVTYEAEADKFDKFLPTAEKIIKSLQIQD